MIVTNSYDCSSTDDINVGLYSNPVVSIGSDTSLNDIDNFLLDAGSGFSSYNWSTGENSQDVLVNEFGVYWVQVADANGCIGSDTIAVTQIQNNLFLPNMFTPNGDGSNDALLLYGNGFSEEILFQIYNRWGEVVYSTSSFTELKTVGWK